MLMIRAAERTRNITYAIRDISVLAKEVEKKKKVVCLNIGDPNKFDFDTPAHLKRAAIKAMNNRCNYYADSQGVEEALDSIVKCNKKLGMHTDEKSVMVLSGVSEGIQICTAAIANPGENMVIPRPSYPFIPLP
jgi:alanine-synthesizing transaminase